MGAGKSSAVNSFRKALGMDGWIAPTGATGGHVTTKLHKYVLIEDTIEFYDTMCWALQNYTDNTMFQLLKGRIPLERDLSGNIQELLCRESTSWTNKINTCSCCMC